MACLMKKIVNHKRKSHRVNRNIQLINIQKMLIINELMIIIMVYSIIVV